MRPNPISDVISFLTKPSVFTLFYWLLLIAACGIAAMVWRRDPAQRTGHALGILILRFFTGTMWWQQSLWKIPPNYGGLIYWTKQEVKHAAVRLESNFLHYVALPHIAIFGPLAYTIEVVVGVSLMLGVFSRFGALIGLAEAVELWLGEYSTPHEWPWTYFFLIIIMGLFWLDPPGRVLGFDALSVSTPQYIRSKRLFLA